MSKVFAVSGVKNSGKTTLAVTLIAALTARGWRVATVKHDGHGFVPDVEQTDTRRHWDAGACGTAVFDGEKYMMTRRQKVDERALLALFPEADFILLEGFKHSDYPKFEVVRAGNSAAPVCRADTLLALVTDLPLAVPGVPTLGLDDVDAMADLVESLGKERV